MKKALTPILLAAVLLCGTACAQRKPLKYINGDMTGIGDVTLDIASGDETEDVTQLRIDDPRRVALASKWDGNMQMVGSNSQIFTFSHGIGTQEEPYLLSSALDVARFAANVRFRGESGNIYQDMTKYHGQYFRLECDIDMQGFPWYGIGGNGSVSEDMTMFEGTFDGAGHVIYNFALADEPMNGFFSLLGRGGVVKNLGIVSGEITVKSNEVMGLLVAGVRYGGTVENCLIRLSLSAEENAVLRVGAVGRSEEGTVNVQGCQFGYVTLNGEPYDLPDVVQQGNGS